jgi:hypothetical protein
LSGTAQPAVRDWSEDPCTIPNFLFSLQNARSDYNIPSALKGVILPRRGELENVDASFPAKLRLIWHLSRSTENHDFDASLLGLMGISSGTYIGFKFPEKPK